MAFKLESVFEMRDRASGVLGRVKGSVREIPGLFARAARSGGGFGSSLLGAAKSAGRLTDEIIEQNGWVRDTNGRLRDMKGRFVSVEEQAEAAGEKVSRLRQQVDRTGQALTHMRDRARTTFDAVRGGAARARDAIFNLQNGLLVGGAGFAGKSIIDSVGAKEQNLITLEVQVGGVERAKNVYKNLARFAAVTPFETPEVLQGGRMLLSYTYNTKQLLPVLTRAGNLAAGVNKPLAETVEVFGRLKAGDFGDAFERLRDFGISRQLLEGEGLKFDKQGSYKGSAEAAIGAVVRIIDKRFGGLMDRQSRSIFGLASTLKSRPFELFSSLDEGGAMDPLKRFLGNVADLTDFDNNPQGKRIKARFQRSMGGLFKSLFGGLADATEGERAAKLLDRVLDGVDRFSAWWSKNGPGLINDAKAFAGGFKDTFVLVGRVAKPALDLFARVQGLNGGNGGEGAARVAGQVAAGLVLLSLLRTMNGLTGGLAGGLLKLTFKAPVALYRLPGTLAGAAARAATLAERLRLPGVAARLTSLAGRLGAFRLGQTILSGLRSGGLLAARFGGGLVRLGAQGLVMGARLAAAWLIGLGPVGWVIGGVIAVGAAVVFAYKKFAWFRNSVNAAWGWVRQKTSQTVNWFSTLPERMATAGREMVSGLTRGIKERLSSAKEAIQNVGQGVVQKFRDLLGIKSPSRVFRGIGENLVEGLVTGIERRAPMLGQALGWLREKAGSAWEGGKATLGGMWAGAKSGFTGGASGPVPAGRLPKLSAGAGVIARKAMEGLTAGWAESMPGYCSRFVRQVFTKALGPGVSKLFGSSAIQTEANFKRAGYSKTLAQIGGLQGLRPGDALFQGFGSGGFGHTGIYIGNGQVAQNTTARGGGKMVLPLSAFGRITSVGRVPAPALPGPPRPTAPMPRAARAATVATSGRGGVSVGKVEVVYSPTSGTPGGRGHANELAGNVRRSLADELQALDAELGG